MPENTRRHRSVKARQNERLEQITRTAVSIFYKRGYLQTSTQEIADACGISKGNLYHYIKCKEDLLSNSIKISSAQIEKLAKAMARELRTARPSVVLARAVRRTLMMVDDLQEMILFWYRESGNVSPASLEKLIRQDMYTVDLYRQIFEEGVRRGEFRVSDPMLAAFDVMMLCDMWSLKRWYMRKRYTLDQYIARCQELSLAIALGERKPPLPEKPGKAAVKRVSGQPRTKPPG